jgi:hypothetical protein
MEPYITVVEVVSNNPLTIDADATVTRTREFVVRLRDKHSTAGDDAILADAYSKGMVPVLLLKASQIPKWHSHDPIIPGIWCTNISITPDTNEVNVWRVTCDYEGISIPCRGVAATDYSTFFGTGNNPGSTPFLEKELPWHIPPELIFEEPEVTEVVTGMAYDYAGTAQLVSPNGFYASTGDINWSGTGIYDTFANYIRGSKPTFRVPITNTVDEAYTDPPAITQRNKTYTWRWKRPAIVSGGSSYESSDYMKAWNKMEGTFNAYDIVIMGVGMPCGTALVKSATQKKLAFMGFPYYEYSLTVVVNRTGWITPILNKGTKYKLTSDASTYTPYNTETGGTEALKLTNVGTALSEGEEPYWRAYILHPWQDWGFLGLPSESNPSYFAAGVV